MFTIERIRCVMQNLGQYQVNVWKRSAALENLDDNVNANKVCENITENMNFSAKER
jgi:hypothetical protein